MLANIYPQIPTIEPVAPVAPMATFTPAFETGLAQHEFLNHDKPIQEKVNAIQNEMAQRNNIFFTAGKYLRKGWDNLPTLNILPSEEAKINYRLKLNHLLPNWYPLSPQELFKMRLELINLDKSSGKNVNEAYVKQYIQDRIDECGYCEDTNSLLGVCSSEIFKVNLDVGLDCIERKRRKVIGLLEETSNHELLEEVEKIFDRTVLRAKRIDAVVDAVILTVILSCIFPINLGIDFLEGQDRLAGVAEKLVNAAQDGELDRLNTLLELYTDRAQLAADARLALIQAARSDHSKLVERLLDFDDVKQLLGYDVNTDKLIILQELAEEYNWTTARMTKSAGKEARSFA